MGRITVNLKNMDNEILFLRENLIKELNSRGIKTAYSESGNADIALNVKKFRIRNHRSTGFSPFQTETILSADAIGKEQSIKLAFYFRIGKVPIWSMKEVEDPCYNMPLSLLIKELASKINHFYYGYRSSDEEVERLFSDITNNYEEDVTFLRVLELGYTNNTAAIPKLVQLSNHDDAYMRLAALCFLGMLGAVDEFEFLKECYFSRKKDEKLMALKSIGDLNTPEARAFLETTKNSADYEERIKEVIDLYLAE